MARDEGRPRRRFGRLSFLVLFILLVLVRVPSLVEPAGADQGLYAYMGQRILDGGWPYRDAWDQKPPAIHATYALMFGLWPDPAIINVADLAVATLTSLVLLGLGRRLGTAAGAGEASALLFLFLSNPAFGRLGGVRVRSQCEVFIALAVSLAFLTIWHARTREPHGRGSPGRWLLFAGGLLVGIAVLYKYNAVLYAVPAVLALIVWPGGALARHGFRSSLLCLTAGILTPVATLLVMFAGAGLLSELYRATVAYNMFYSSETYAGTAHFVRNLVTFPVQHARVDSLWWLGGLGCVVLLGMSVVHPRLLVVPVWVAAGCLSIAINGSRGLPQYFLQLGPPLALATGIFLAAAWGRVATLGRAVLLTLVAVGIWRVTLIPKAVDYTLFDLSRMNGHLDRETHLARFGETGGDQKYSALAIERLAARLSVETTAAEPVLVFGFSPGALVLSERVSASRFFWSRPLVVGFARDTPGYGPAGLLAELERTRPRLVVLQRNDWQDSADSASFFLEDPQLGAWLRASYRQVGDEDNFLIWRREGA